MDERLKRRLLAEAVDENLRTIRNQPPGRPARHRSRLGPALAGLAVGLAVVAGLVVAARRPAPAVAAPPVSSAALPELARTPFGAPDATVDEGAAALLTAPPARVPGGVFPLAVRRIVLDPGHGGGDQGTRTPSGLLEKELTLDIARRLAERLRAAGIEPLLTREEDQRVALVDRAGLASRSGADLFVSIHVNWLEDGRANRGIETFYLGPSDDPAVTRLASSENLDSGYSLADTRRLLDSIYADLRQEQSRALARAVQHRLVRSIREVAPEVADRGVKSAPFLVLVATEVPAILAEVACLSNADEAKLLGQPDYRERIATALFDGIAAYSDSVQQARTAAVRERELR
jgi:N-acetylmuramoyl-L-alanine amidase